MSPHSAAKRIGIIAWLLSTALALAACATSAEPGGNEITVVATTSIMGGIASGVMGDQGDVEVLIPIGVDSHDFLPSAQQASLIAGAGLVVANGLGLEQGLQDLLEASERDGTRIVELAPLVDPLPFSEHGGHDPHFWMDPIRVGAAAEALAAELTKLYPDGGWQQRAQGYVAEMESTDRAINDLFDGIPNLQRLMVTNHQAFGYFAARYGFEVIGVVIPGGSTLAEPSSAELAALVETMEREGARVIFAETSQPSALAESVAAELGDDVRVVELFTESLGSIGSGAETLSKMLYTNAERMASALG